MIIWQKMLAYLKYNKSGIVTLDLYLSTIRITESQEISNNFEKKIPLNLTMENLLGLR